MLCSKSSNWLHRLRSSRGFPDSDHIDLEHFLSTSHLIESTDSPSPDKRTSLNKRHDDDEAIQGRDVIENVLSELFHMGEFQDLSRIRRKKSCRKQQCPRICVVSTNFSDGQSAPVKKNQVSERSPLPLTLSSRRKAKEVSRELKVTERVVDEEEEEVGEKGHLDLSAYSQTEVTIIDSSVPAWKFEKMLYRRKNVWKVGDKKGKGLLSSDRKKRKEIVNENGDVQRKKKKKFKLCSSSSKSGNAEEDEEKKKKKKKKKLKVCNSSKIVDNEEALVRLKSTQGHDQGKTTVAACEKKEDNSSQLQEKSSLKKQINGGPSVILIKSIPTTNKKDVTGISKNFVKSMQK